MCIEFPACPAGWHSVVVWLHSGHNNFLSVFIFTVLKYWPYRTVKGWVRLAYHSLTLWLMNHLMDGDHRVLVGVVLLVVHCSGSDRYLLFFDPPGPTARESSENMQGIQLSNFLCLLSSYAKSPMMPFWVCEIPSPEAIYAKHPQDLWASHNELFLTFTPSQAHFSFQESQLLGFPCHSNTHGFCVFHISNISWWLQGTLYAGIN